jgi:uncharacterized protein (DUF58 family)
MPANAPTGHPRRRACTAQRRLLRRLEWTVIRRLDGLLQGDYRTLMRGGGVDLADLREYQLHDDVRHIDWNVTARLQQPYVRQFTEDRDLTAWFLLDLRAAWTSARPTSPSWRCPPASWPRWRVCITRHGNRVGALLYGTRSTPCCRPRRRACTC